MKKETAKAIRLIGRILFIMYMIALIYFLFFSEEYGRTMDERHYSYNLTLLKEIKRFIIYRKQLGMFAVLTNLAGNIIGFIPFGMILPVIIKRFRNFKMIALLSFELSLSVETIQLLFKVGSFDVDDLLLNTLGGVLGYFIFAAADHIRRKLNG